MTQCDSCGKGKRGPRTKTSQEAWRCPECRAKTEVDATPATEVTELDDDEEVCMALDVTAIDPSAPASGAPLAFAYAVVAPPCPPPSAPPSPAPASEPDENEASSDEIAFATGDSSQQDPSSSPYALSPFTSTPWAPRSSRFFPEADHRNVPLMASIGSITMSPRDPNKLLPNGGTQSVVSLAEAVSTTEGRSDALWHPEHVGSSAAASPLPHAGMPAGAHAAWLATPAPSRPWFQPPPPTPESVGVPQLDPPPVSCPPSPTGDEGYTLEEGALVEADHPTDPSAVHARDGNGQPHASWSLAQEASGNQANNGDDVSFDFDPSFRSMLARDGMPGHRSQPQSSLALSAEQARGVPGAQETIVFGTADLAPPRVTRQTAFRITTRSM